jgi:cytochrome c556
MKVRQVAAAVAGLGLAVTAIAGCASGDKKMASRAPADVVAERQRLMKLHGGLWRDIQEKAKAGNVEGIAVSAEALALNAQRIAPLFPKGSITDKSKAKPEIWDKWAEFEAAAKKLETESEKLRDAALTKNAGTTQDVMKDFGRNACGSCHTPFRVPPPRQG